VELGGCIILFVLSVERGESVNVTSDAFVAVLLSGYLPFHADSGNAAVTTRAVLRGVYMRERERERACVCRLTNVNEVRTQVLCVILNVC
jgi:hypothetical protein